VEVFISWSEERSQQLARALRDWLPQVIQQIDPFMSSEDIPKGQRWLNEINARLEKETLSVICVTPESLTSAWLNFEVGALAKSLDGARVCPLLLGLSPAEVHGPLSQFQAAVVTEREDMFRLAASINEGCARPLSAARLERAFTLGWSDFLDVVRGIEAGAGPMPVRPSTTATQDSAVLELLASVRELLRHPCGGCFGVRLTAVPGQKIQVIKRVREITKIGLKEAKDLVDGAERVVLRGVSRHRAESAAGELRQVTEEVEVIPLCAPAEEAAAHRR